ncbi:syntaxin [Akanthomyces lecanii RCEF 1005]|uniref:Syntaxin n=1 Tax=Akanthomyces lecanii RCEF 1005 TaxID=1081108 RepID=A0A167W1P5_CORDF|nr:syntaxin [Akanthomyces lecanii RCEF 1005]
MAGEYGYRNQQNLNNQRGQGYGGGPQRGNGDHQGGYGGQQRPQQQRPQQQQNPYGGQGGYGQQQQQENPYAAGGSNSCNANTNNSSMDCGYAGSNVEMAPLAQTAGSMAGAQGNAILNECRKIDGEIGEIERNLEELRQLQQRTLNDADSSSSSAANRELDARSDDTMSLYHKLTERIRTIKSNPEALTPKNKPQVGRVERRLKQAIQQYQQLESSFQKNTQDQIARQYRIVRPDASKQEVEAAIQDPTNNQVFSQALMQSDRQGRAHAALSVVNDRHKALVKIEQQMVELSQLFLHMDTLVLQQEAAVVQVEQKGEEAVENLDKGNEEMGVAVNTARKTRRKKWICLGICVAIIVVIVVAVLIYIFINRSTKNK